MQVRERFTALRCPILQSMPLSVQILGTVSVMPNPDLHALLDSWELDLQAQRKSSGTIGVYLRGVRQYLTWCAENDRPAEIDRKAVKAFIAELLTDEYDDHRQLIRRGAEANTAIARQLAIRRFSAWLAEEDEIDTDPLLGMKPPKADQKVIDPLTPEQLVALIKACEGRDLRARRDEAIVRFIAETGARAGETVAMTVPDTDLKTGTAVIRRGKGGKGRRVPFGPQTARAIDRYLRLRRTHRLAETPKLWLGERGKGFGYDGLLVALQGRAEAAGIPDFYPHRLRHTMADRWLEAGGTESGLMAVAGWARPEMLLRYTRARAEARAASEAKRLNLGDL